MTIADRQELQRRLTAAGFDTGGTDGVIGPKTAPPSAPTSERRAGGDRRAVARRCWRGCG